MAILNRKIITCTGYGGTGSSAITDLLKEFDCGLSMGDAEFWFLQDYDGISDLEYFLIDGNHRSKVSLAIERYIKYIQKNNSFYSKIFATNFIKYSNEYIESLIDARFKKALSYYEVDNNFLRVWHFKIYPRLQLLARKILRQNTFEFSPYIPLINKTYSIPDRSRFYKKTKKYTHNLFNLLDVDNKYKFLAFDQLVPTTNISRYLNYVENMKVVVVDRDPRDLYLLNEIQWKGASYVCDTSNVYEYIDWYKTMRLHRKSEKKSDNILYIMIEDLIYNYEKTLNKLYKFLDLTEEEHTHKRKHFNPEISITWTRLWEKNPNYTHQVKIIEEQLSEYCYN